MIRLPGAFLSVPIAHRAYHDRTDGRPENSRAAFKAAISAGYGIECDVQMSKDEKAVVFHDETLERLTGQTGRVRDLTLDELTKIRLRNSDETIPSLPTMLDLVSGQVPLLIEVKDQDGALGRDVGALERAVARDLKGYSGPVALMSFNPHSVAALAEAAPRTARGIVTSAYRPEDWPEIPAETRDRLRDIPDYDRVGASFISHEADDLARQRVADLKQEGAAILTWTIRNAGEEQAAREYADNITFEGYAARRP